MQFSIEVLPAPLGPMIALTSPLRISKDTSEIAFTPPKRKLTFSTASSTSRGACVVIGSPVIAVTVAFMPPSRTSGVRRW